MIVTKVIKPKRLKDSAMRLELLNAMRKAGTAVRKDFAKTTETWTHKPKFETVVSLAGPGPELLVGTDDLIYKFVDEGTKAHEIWAGYWTGKSDKKSLAFPSEFEPKTTPKVIDSGPGFSGGDIVLRQHVHHPGIEAREFDKTLAHDWEKPFKERMEDAMRKAAAKSGHGA